MPETTLIIDDDAIFNAVLVRTLERRGHPARGAADPVAALAVAAEISPARVVLDLNLNGSSGLALIPQLLAINPACRIVVSRAFWNVRFLRSIVNLSSLSCGSKMTLIPAAVQSAW